MEKFGLNSHHKSFVFFGDQNGKEVANICNFLNCASVVAHVFENDIRPEKWSLPIFATNIIGFITTTP